MQDIPHYPEGYSWFPGSLPLKNPIILLPYKYLYNNTRRHETAGCRSNTPRRIRTPNLLVRSQALYPIELWAHILLILSQIVAEREGFEPSVER